MNDSRIPCRAFLEDFSAFVDGRLPPRRRDEIQAHVDCCQGCLDHLTAYRRGITVLRSIEAQAPDDFWTRLERRLWLGDELAVVDVAGGRTARKPAWRSVRWPTPAGAVAAAAVLALFVIVRGFGPGSTSVEVGPQRIQASVAMKVPEVPGADAARPIRASEVADADGSRAVASAPRRAPRTANTSADPAESVLVRVDSRATTSFEREIRRLQESVFQESRRRMSAESGLISDGWVQPVRLGGDWSRTGIRRASLVRTASAVTPAPWNVDQAVSLP
jgi:hypothetical protein